VEFVDVLPFASPPQEVGVAYRRSGRGEVERTLTRRVRGRSNFRFLTRASPVDKRASSGRSRGQPTRSRRLACASDTQPLPAVERRRVCPGDRLAKRFAGLGLGERVGWAGSQFDISSKVGRADEGD
jgi:hypothetical protein